MTKKALPWRSADRDKIIMNYGKPLIARRMRSDADAYCASDLKGGIYPFIEDTSDSTNNRGYEP
jgi:hypothetical protein